MAAFVEALKQLWALLTQMGVAQLITGVIASGAITVWSYIEGAKTSELVFIALVVFCVVFVSYNSARFVYREYKQFPDYKAWDRVSSPTIWQVACLWARQTPYSKIGADTKAYPYLQMLKNDIDDGILIASIDPGNETMWRRIKRADLIDYADKKGEKPPFLFPDAR